MSQNFKHYFDNLSILPLFLFLSGIYTTYLIGSERYSQAIFILILSFVLYSINNVMINMKENISHFNEYLEDMATFTTFGINPILFGIVFFKDDMLILSVVFFFAITTMLSLARNWQLGVKNSCGWPIPLNGIFFPLTYYIYEFYLQAPGNSIFILYYIIVGLMSASNYNFLGYEEKDRFIKAEKRKESEEYEEEEYKPIGIKDQLVAFYNPKKEEEKEDIKKIDISDYEPEEIDENTLIEDTFYDEEPEIKEEKKPNLYLEKIKLMLWRFKQLFNFKKKNRFSIDDMPDKKEVKETLEED